MTRLLSAVLLCLAAQWTLAEETAAGKETPPAEKTDSELAADAQAEATAKKGVPVPGDADYKPPPGFKVKKQGQHLLYCMRDRTTGTRFATEKCYSGEQMREYLLALEIQKRDIDRIRSTCVSGSVCAPQ